MTEQDQQTIGINVGLEPGADWQKIKCRLEDLGGKEIRDPSAENPDLLRVRLPVTADRNAFIEDAKAVPGVRYVEEDAWFFAS